MSKFWTLSALLLLLGVALLATDSTGKLDVGELSSVCDHYQSNFREVSIEDSRIKFEGAFRNGPSANPSHSYSQNGNSIKLRVDSGSSKDAGCRKAVLYGFKTSELSSGRYDVEVFHDERRVYSASIDVR